MSRSDELEAEAKVVRLEEALKDAKESDEDYSELKYELREARREFRELRQQNAAPPPEGDARADAQTAQASGQVEE